jgi:hypothetical protein
MAVWIFVLRIEQGEYAGWPLLLNMRQYMKNIQQIWGVPQISRSHLVSMRSVGTKKT